MGIRIIRVAKRYFRWFRGIPQRKTGLGVHVQTLLDLHYNEVLKSELEVDGAIRSIGWEHPVRWKTWDLLKATHFVKQHAPSRETRVLDVGCNGSPILEVLHTEGYRNLFGCDFTDSDLPRVRGLVFHRGNLMGTPWPDNHFGVVSCISVIEHGFDADKVLREMARLIALGGYLLISTDYANPKIDTSEVDRGITYGMPWTIFCRQEIEEFIDAANHYGFELIEPIRWDQEDYPVVCSGKTYTFVFFALKRT